MQNLNDIFVGYRRKWTQRLLRMKNTRIPKLVYEYVAAGRRNTGRPRKDRGTNIPEALSTYTLWLMIIMMVIMMMMMMTVQVYASL